MFFSSLFALGYWDAGRRHGIGDVMEEERDRRERREKGDRQIDGGHVRKRVKLTAKETDKQAEIREKLRRCEHKCTHKQQKRFVTSFLFACLSSTSIPSSLPQQVLLSSRSLFSPSVLPSPTPPHFCAFSSFSCSSLQYTVPRGDSSKSNCLSISHQCTASRGSCPLKTMKVGLSAEPGIRFNYINKELCFTKR